MANRRMIASDIFEDDFIGGLNYFERLLWIGLITSVADDQGRMMDNPALIRIKVFLYDTVSDQEVEATLQKLSTANKIVRYVDGYKALIQIVNWWKYQTPSWASPSKYPAPEGWQDRAKYHGSENKIITHDWDKIGGYVADYVAPKDSAIEERKGKERKGSENIPSSLSDKFTDLTKILPYNLEEWTEAIQTLEAAHVTLEDITVTIQKMDEDHLTYSGLWSIVKTATWVKSQREAHKPIFNNGGHSHIPQPDGV